MLGWHVVNSQCSHGIIYLVQQYDRLQNIVTYYDILQYYEVLAQDFEFRGESLAVGLRCTNKSTGAERAVKMLRKVRRKSQLIMPESEAADVKNIPEPAEI